MAEQRVQVSVGLKDGVGWSRATETAGVIADNTKTRYEDRKLLIPHSAIEIAAVEQYNGGPATDRLVIESAAGDGNRSRVGPRCRGALGARQKDTEGSPRQEGDTQQSGPGHWHARTESA